MDQCAARYVRPDGTEIRCTFLVSHPAPQHSFYGMKTQDEADARSGIGCDDETPSDVQTLLDNITAGKADPYLEAVLAVAHNRKRALRGTRGFNRL